jgi:hypothetical protein
VTCSLFLVVASAAAADTLELSAPATVKSDDSFTLTVTGSSVNGGTLTIGSVPSSQSCPATDDSIPGLTEAYQNGQQVEWPLGAQGSGPAGSGPFSVALTVGAAEFPTSATTLCGYLDSTDDNDNPITTTAETKITVQSSAVQSAPNRSCKVAVARISKLVATAPEGCRRAIFDVKAFARSYCATRDGVLLRSLDGSGWQQCDATRTLVCQAIGERHGSRIGVVCGRIGELGFLGDQEIQFVYKLRKLL